MVDVDTNIQHGMVEFHVIQSWRITEASCSPLDCSSRCSSSASAASAAEDDDCPGGVVEAVLSVESLPEASGEGVLGTMVVGVDAGL